MLKKKIRIHATFNGPYVVEGKAPIQEMAIEKDESSKAWTYKPKKRLNSKKESVKLCRCG